MNRHVITCLLLASWFVCGSAVFGQTTDEWQYELAPYIWGTGIEGDVAFKGIETSIDASFSDISENLDFGFMLHFEGDKPDWGYFTDITFADLSADGAVGAVTASVDGTMWIVELGGAYRLSGTPLGSIQNTRRTELIFGGRYWNIDQSVDLGALGGVGQSDNWVDPFVGARYTTPISGRWGFRTRFDLGGFGVGSDFTWNLTMLFGYESSSRGTLALGYRILDVDRESGSGTDFFKYDVTMGGPVIGYDFRF